MIYNALSLSHEFLKFSVKTGANVIDATAGNGNDTAFLCSLVSNTGHVTAFDIQKDAVKSTIKKVESLGYRDFCDVILDSHENMHNYFSKNSVDAVVFNFGWLPGGDHNIHTKKETSIAAINSALSLLKPGGVISMCVYYGKNNGYEEKEAIINFVKELDFRKYTVMHISFPNRVNDPPFPIFIVKEA